MRQRMEVSPEKAVEVRLGILALEAGVARPVTMPGLEQVDEPEFGHEQPYGPMSAWVVANARAVLGLEHLDILVAHMELASHAGPSNVTAAALQMTADGVDRSASLGSTRVLANRVSAQLQHRKDWQVEVEDRAEDLGLTQRDVTAPRYLAGHLDVFVQQVLAACALEDVMQPRLRLQALGAWRCLTSATEDDPGLEWRCSDQTAEMLRRYFAPMDEDALVWAIGGIADSDDPARDRLEHRLIGSTLVRAASPPPLAEIVGPGLVDVLPFRGGRSMINQLARLLAALCEPPEWLSTEDLLMERARLGRSSDIDWPARS